MFADTLKYLLHIIERTFNIFAETHSQYMIALLKCSPHLEPLRLSLKLDVKVKTLKKQSANR